MGISWVTKTDDDDEEDDDGDEGGVGDGDDEGDDVFDLLFPLLCLLLLVCCHTCDMVNYLANTPLTKLHDDIDDDDIDDDNGDCLTINSASHPHQAHHQGAFPASTSTTNHHLKHDI